MPSLLTLLEVKDALNIEATNVRHDVELQRYIDACLPQIEYITGPIFLRSVSETQRIAPGLSKIALRQVPVYSIESVTEYVGLTAYTLSAQPPGLTINNYGYSLDLPETGILRRTSSVGQECAFLGNVIVIKYTAGVGTVPADVHLAAIEDVRGLYQQTQQPGRPQYGGSPATEDGWSAGPIMLFPRLAALLQRASRTQSIG